MESGWHTTRVVRREAEPGDLIASSFLEETFKTALADVNPDLIIHAVGAAGPLSPRALFEANVLSAIDLFSVLDKLGSGAAVVLVGSAAEYGSVSSGDLPVSEEHACLPQTIYGISKLAQTLLGLSQTRRPVLCARLFNPIGAGMPSYLALGDFAGKIRQKTTELRVGNLDVRRDFICVEEAARLIVSLCDIPDAFGQIINICVGEAFRLGGIVDQLVGLAPQAVRIAIDPSRMRNGEMPEFYGSTARLQQYGLTPRPPDFTSILKRMLSDSK